MVVYISGGCKNGKSSIAEKIAYSLKEDNKPFYYIATMSPLDEEDKKRIIKHKKDREHLFFETIEIPTNIREIEKKCNLEGTFLIDSMTALLANEMFINNEVIDDAYKNIINDLLYIIPKMKNVIIVSDYIFSDSIKYDSITNKYKKGLAFIDRRCAKISDILIEVCYNNIIVHKGRERVEEIKLC
ncbi:bifunctional adenosylcobinamide kinase/adenosylcobinamide-phosphate guanylyltransferase [uncultured Tyzzerella sp.]|uniref:bifunctional adenosylcobinamide kinase/adenosylcobinamide-phosphate guanylyltransferase n=1 Tax=uncultured Tyzzerella sp. TaxID=2321398 RepID=UPI0029425CB6|nr:bifunctional adenosylcobinamide kinase/adenosylcobinamide-phosphate guanylyltransferase [uncultured Tyzzerella sp.]